MPRAPRPRKTISDSLHRKLNMYVIAAGAAEVGALALAQPVDAKVVYTDTGSISIGWNHTYPLDLNHDGKMDFAIYNNLFYVTSGELSIVSVKGASGNVVTGSVARIGHPVLALKRGAVIGGVQTSPRYRFQGSGTMAFDCTGGCTGGTEINRGAWRNVSNRYLGLRFHIKGKTHYGWARLSVLQIRETYDHPWMVILTGYAYETIPNKPIVTGKTKGPDIVTVQPGSAPATLGRLALGRK